MGQKMRGIGVEVQSLGMHLRAGDPFGLLLLARRLRVKQPDLVQTWMYHANLVGGLAAKMAGGIPVVWNIRAGGDNFDGYRMDTMVAISLSALASHVLPARIIVNSETSKSNHRDLGYSRTHMTVIPNGFDTRAFRPNSDSRLGVRTELGLGPKAFLIGLIARFHPQKGHDNFLQAASILLSRFDNVHFLLCGLGVTPENDGLIKLIEKTGHRRNFHLLGETDDVPRVTAAIDIATSSSISESFSNTLGDAMACGVPCIATDVGDSSRLIGATGIVVPPRRPDLLAAAWMKLISIQDSERTEMGIAARHRIEEFFSLRAVSTRYESLYQEIIG